MSTEIDKLSQEEKDILLRAPAVVAILAAISDDGEVSKHEKAESIKLSHLRTYTSEEMLHNFYSEAEKKFEVNFDDIFIEGITQITNLLKIDDSSATYEPYFDYDYGYDAGTDYELPLHPDDDPPYESDLSIHEDIRDELYWSPYVDSEDITVEVEDGIATLSGEVDSYDEYLDARINAYEGGAWRVKSSDLEIGDDS